MYLHGAKVIEAKSVSRKPWVTTEGGPTGWSGINDEPYYNVYHEGFDSTYLVLEHNDLTVPFAVHNQLLGEGLLGKSVKVLGNKGTMNYTAGERIPWTGDILYDEYYIVGNTLVFSSAHWKESKFYLESSADCPFTVSTVL